MGRNCSLCGAEMKLDKIFPAKSGRVKKRERYKCTDPTCLNEETIQPSNEERAKRIEDYYRGKFRNEKNLARDLRDA